MSLPVGSRLRFRARFLKDGKEFPVSVVTAMVNTPGGSVRTLTLGYGLERAAPGIYQFELVADQAGYYEVVWSSDALGEESKLTERYAVGVTDVVAPAPTPAEVPPPPAAPSTKSGPEATQRATVRMDKASTKTAESSIAHPARKPPPRVVEPVVPPTEKEIRASSTRDLMVKELSKRGVVVTPARTLDWINRKYREVMSSPRR